MSEDALRRTIGESFGELDETAVDLLERVAERRIELLLDPGERNLDIWADGFAALSVDETYLVLSQSELQAVPIDERDVDWLNVVAALHACADTQARTEISTRPLIREAELGARAIVKRALALAPASRRAVAREGVGKDHWTAGKTSARARRGR